MMSPLVEAPEPALTFDRQGTPGVSGLLSRRPVRGLLSLHGFTASVRERRTVSNNWCWTRVNNNNNNNKVSFL